MDKARIIAKLTQAGVRPTAQRIAIAEHLFSADHPTAEDIKRHLDAHFAKASLATVYNTVAVLERAGLIREFKLPHTEKLVYDDNLDRHHHFIDDKTGAVFDVPDRRVTVDARLGKEFKIDRVEVVFHGRIKK